MLNSTNPSNAFSSNLMCCSYSHIALISVIWWERVVKSKYISPLRFWGPKWTLFLVLISDTMKVMGLKIKMASCLPAVAVEFCPFIAQHVPSFHFLPRSAITFWVKTDERKPKKWSKNQKQWAFTSCFVQHFHRNNVNVRCYDFVCGVLKGLKGHFTEIRSMFGQFPAGIKDMFFHLGGKMLRTTNFFCLFSFQ